MKGFLLSFIIFLGFSPVFSQSTIKGKVVDNKGEVIPNAYVIVEGKNKAAVTNLEGEFEFERMSGKVTLLISHVSYDETTIIIEEPYASSMTIELSNKYYLANQVVVEATRAGKEDPTTYSELNEDELNEQNFGQDVPFLLDITPSVTISSDAGAGIGYTSMRIRGSDMTRINVTINGIPLNDSESHGVFWVNTPDLASSTKSVQVQRGVGTSTNGAAAFGATVNMLTSQFSPDPYANWSVSAGSFNTLRNSVEFGTGLLNDHWSLNGRISRINSEGYIDRAESDLESWYFEGGYFGDNTILKFVAFGGNEKTYQSWWGTPEARLKNDVEGMNFVADFNGYSDEQRSNLLNSGRTFNYYLYENEVDNYSQNHYQLHFSHSFNENNTLNLALHSTLGEGYFEQFRENDAFIDYGLEPIISIPDGLINTTDLIRRRWLDNVLVGGTFSYDLHADKLDLTLGGAFNQYNGAHFGEIIWAQYSPNLSIRDRYYDNDAVKTDGNIYAKANYDLGNGWFAYADLQLRNINYTAEGPDHDRVNGVPVEINIEESYSFFNPKVGVSWIPTSDQKAYISYARSWREPVRSDFIDNELLGAPRPERLDNIEMGYEKNFTKGAISGNLYYMGYTDQLVLTGELNDVGASIRRNVDQSYRAGIELAGGFSISPQVMVKGNLTLSRNKVEEFTEVLYDYGVNFDEFNIEETTYSNVDLSYSPSVISSLVLDYKPMENTTLSWVSKFVGRQYLDNTQQASRSIDPFFVNHIRASYSFYPKFFKEIRAGLLVNNILNELYSANGYTFGYKGGGIEVRENYFYPQATRNFLISLDVRF